MTKILITGSLVLIAYGSLLVTSKILRNKKTSKKIRIHFDTLKAKELEKR